MNEPIQVSDEAREAARREALTKPLECLGEHVERYAKAKCAALEQRVKELCEALRLSNDQRNQHSTWREEAVQRVKVLESQNSLLAEQLQLSAYHIKERDRAIAELTEIKERGQQIATLEHRAKELENELGWTNNVAKQSIQQRDRAIAELSAALRVRDEALREAIARSADACVPDDVFRDALSTHPTDALKPVVEALKLQLDRARYRANPDNEGFMSAMRLHQSSAEAEIETITNALKLLGEHQ